MAQPWKATFATLNPVGGRHLVVIDPGTRLLKLMAVRANWRRVRVQQQHSVDLAGEGVLELAETRQHLESLFPELKGWDRAVLLPQDRTICQTVEVPVEGTVETRDYLLREARKLSGLDPASLSWTFTRLRPFGRFRNPWWLTLCKREEVDRVTTRFLVGEELGGGLEEGGLCDITTNAQALFAASRLLRPRPDNAVLVEFRSRLTVVAMLVGGQGCFATSLPIGFAQLAEALAEDGGVDLRTATEALHRGAGFEAPGPRLQAALARWHGSVQTAVREWLEDHPELGLSPVRLRAHVCGSGAQSEVLFRAIEGLGPLRLRPWEGRMPGARGDTASYWVAYGLALHALQRSPHRLSLLPGELETTARRRARWRRWQRVNGVLLLILAVALGIAGLKQSLLLAEKGSQIERAQAVIQATREMVRLHARLNRDYATLHPVLQREQRTLDTLRALAALRHESGERAHWFVLFADADSYAAGTTLPEALRTNRAGPAPEYGYGRREFIAEVVIPLEGDALRTTLGEIVGDLRADPAFRRADVLPPERWRDLVDPAVTITNRKFALSFELSGEAPRPPSALNVPIRLETAAGSPSRPAARSVPASVRILSTFRSRPDSHPEP